MIISLSSPLLVGLYENGIKFKDIVTDEHVSEALISLLDELDSNYKIEKIIYANTPGSFMGLKTAYIILKTFCLVRDCEFLAVSGFELNGGRAIRANKKLSFVMQDKVVVLKPDEPSPFVLPQKLSMINLGIDTLPEYIIEPL